MPNINEREAKIYFKIGYKTPQASHRMTLFMANISALGTATYDGVETLAVMKADTTNDFVAIPEIVHEVFTRGMYFLPSGTIVQSIEVWQAVLNAPNTFVGIVAPKSGASYGTGQGVASSYFMQVYSAANRQKARIEFFDGGFVSPQKTGLVAPPSADNNSLVWYVLKSGVPFATSDGHLIKTAVSENVGYNRRLARKYGRAMTP